MAIMDQAEYRSFSIDGYPHAIGSPSCCGGVPCGIGGCSGMVHQQYLGESYDRDSRQTHYDYEYVCDTCGM